MKLIENLKFRKKLKAYDKASKEFPLWNYKARKEGFACWEDYAVFYKALTPEQIKELHTFEIMKGREQNGCKPLLWTAEDWQNYLAG